MKIILQDKDIIYNMNMLKYELKIERILTLLYYFLVITLIAVGFYLRIKLYLVSYPFWVDEIYLGASFTDRGIKEMFEPLDFVQKVPPFFCILCLLVTKIAGFSELSLRFIPLVAGLLSVLGFYYLLTLIYKNKLVILTGLTLFSINISLIYYSQDLYFSVDNLLKKKPKKYGL